MTQNILPGRQDILNQNLYRQMNLGYTPFVGAFQAENVDNLNYAVGGRPDRGSNYFEWGPTMGTGKPWGFTGKGWKYEKEYAKTTMLPWLHWLYKGDPVTWAMQLLAWRKSNSSPLSVGSMDIIKSYFSGGAGGKSSLLMQGLTKPAQDDYFSGKGWKLKGASIDKQKQLEDLFDPSKHAFDGMWANELENLARMNQLPSTRKDIDTKSLVGGVSNRPRFKDRKGKLGRVDPNKVAQETSELAKQVATGVVSQFKAPDANKIPGSIFEDYKPYKGESAEESMVAINMDMLNENRGSSFDADVQAKWQAQQGGYKDSDRQFFKGSKVGALSPKSKDGQNARQNVDISTKGMEGNYVYFLKEQGGDDRLKNMVRMSKEASVGIEITAMDIFDKGGYKTDKVHADIETALSSIDDFNDSQIKLIQEALDDNSQDLLAAVKSIESSAKKEDDLSSAGEYLEFQTRQTGVRLLDAAFDGIDQTQGFEFVAPTNVGGQQYLINFGFTVVDRGGAEPWDIQKTPAIAEKMADGMTFFIDLIGSVSMGGDAEWLDWRNNKMYDTILRETQGSQATDDLLYGWVTGDFDAGIARNVYPETVVGYKIPAEVADNLSQLMQANLRKNTADEKFTQWLKEKTWMMSNLWKDATGTDTWEGTRNAMKNNNPFGGDLTPGSGPKVNQLDVTFC